MFFFPLLIGLLSDVLPDRTGAGDQITQDRKLASAVNLKQIKPIIVQLCVPVIPTTAVVSASGSVLYTSSIHLLQSCAELTVIYASAFPVFPLLTCTRRLTVTPGNTMSWCSGGRASRTSAESWRCCAGTCTRPCTLQVTKQTEQNQVWAGMTPSYYDKIY